MKVKLITTLTIVVWIVVSYCTALMCNHIIHNIGATRITVEDVIGCYVFPSIFWAIIAFIVWIKLIGD